MWTIKQFKTKEAMSQWLEKNQNKIQFTELFINNSYGLEYRKLRTIY
jgi:hypothetical protein